jgi:phosphohistidine phosphatase SixA
MTRSVHDTGAMNCSRLAATLVLALVVAVGCGGDDGPPAMPDANTDVVVYVVRHAETGSTATDPPLDATGQARAQALATRLADAGIGAAFSSQYARTRETALPTATAAGITVTALPVTSANAATYGMQLVTAVSDANVRAALIAGHSNTVPDTVKAFTGMTIAPIAESEFDRIYTITLATDGAHLEEARYP